MFEEPKNANLRIKNFLSDEDIKDLAEKIKNV